MTTRVRTGVPGLDELLGGGLIAGSANLVVGATGTGKTTLGMQFLYNGVVQYDEPGLLVTFEEFPFSLMRDARSFGWDLGELEEANKLRIVFTSPSVFLANLEAPASPLSRIIREWEVRRVVLDSVTHLQRITVDPVELRKLETTVVNGLKREGLTSLMTCEADGLNLRLDQDRLAYVVDTILLARHVEVDSAIQRALMVLKMRGSAHAQGIHRYEIRREGIVVTEKFEGLRGLLTGTPSHEPRAY
jgi:circadian clock protein KaiC